MPAAKYDFTDKAAWEQGATLLRNITWKDGMGAPVNLTDYTARMQVRESIDAPTVLMELTTENGGITLGGVAGTIVLSQDAVTMAAVTWTSGVYDLELVAGVGGQVTRLLSGRIKVNPEVTR
jgi:hypothetical protein